MRLDEPLGLQKVKEYGDLAAKENKQKLVSSSKSTETRAQGVASNRKITDSFKLHATWATSSVQHPSRVRLLSRALVTGGVRTTFVDNPELGAFLHAMKPKFALPKRCTFDKDINDMMSEVSQAVRNRPSETRRLTVCLDLWTKKRLTASFLSTSACGYNPVREDVEHPVFNLHKVHHPHTGDMITEMVSDTMTAWGIRTSKVMLVVTDNGSNMMNALSSWIDYHS